MSNFKFVPHADATATLGTIHNKIEGRDAIHLAVYQVEMATFAQRGTLLRLGEDGLAYPTGNKDLAAGILDPFLESADKGDKVWLILFPGMIKSLRHVWDHPIFPDVPEEPNLIDHINSFKKAEVIKPVKERKRKNNQAIDSGLVSATRSGTATNITEEVKSVNEAVNNDSDKIEAREYLEKVANDINLDLEELIIHAEQFAEYGNYYVGGSECEGYYLNEEKFWKSYVLYTGKEHPKDRAYSFISCSC